MASMCRTLIGALALSALLASSAHAQMPNINLMPEVKSKTPEEKERDDKADKAYRESLRKIPDSKAASDPWGDVRGANAAKPVAREEAKSKPSQPKPSQPKRAKADIPPN